MTPAERRAVERVRKHYPGWDGPGRSDAFIKQSFTETIEALVAHEADAWSIVSDEILNGLPVARVDEGRRAKLASDFFAPALDHGQHLYRDAFTASDPTSR